MKAVNSTGEILPGAARSDVGAQSRLARSPCPDDRRCRSETLAVVLAGGKGSRLGALTRHESKPALPFGGHFRNIDFSLSNCVNSGIRRIAVVTQYKSDTLIEHVGAGWGCGARAAHICVWAPRRPAAQEYAGTADAIYKNLDAIGRHEPEFVLILAGDHVYKMDYGPMIAAHERSNAVVTIGCTEVPIAQASSFGVVSADRGGRITAFDEKPRRPRHKPGDPAVALASMGIYVFRRRDLARLLTAGPGQSIDFGHDVLPRVVEEQGAFAHVPDGPAGESAYWRDVGTIETYWQAHMDLLRDPIAIDVFGDSWPIWTRNTESLPARLTRDAVVMNSIVAPGCSIAGHVSHSVLFARAAIGPDSIVDHSLVLPGAAIGPQCVVRNAIVGNACTVAAGNVIDGGVPARSDAGERSAGVAVATAESLRGGGKARDLPTRTRSPYPNVGVGAWA